MQEYAGPPKRPPEPPPSVVHIIHGAVIGYSIGHYRRPTEPNQPPNEVCTLEPGDTFVLTTVAGAKLKPVYDRFVVTDYIKTEMSEYDSNYVYVPLDHWQRLRGMDDKVTTIQIKLHNYADAPLVASRLPEMF